MKCPWDCGRGEEEEEMMGIGCGCVVLEKKTSNNLLYLSNVQSIS